MRFTVAEVLPGAITEFNAAGTKPGDVAIWNSMITAAYLGMHFTKDSSVYAENVWNWVADRITGELDGGSSIVAKGRALVESTKGTWLHALGFEHYWLYQINRHNAENAVVSMLQTETNYEHVTKPIASNGPRLLPVSTTS
ncbi:hypothetical protein IL306_001629 [Fusarium sp. DS 682]|nr:hypothetical protein IL306_001629 [Fusarium sp. DS 682]